jgi:hypothetical protein
MVHAMMLVKATLLLTVSARDPAQQGLSAQAKGSQWNVPQQSILSADGLLVWDALQRE